MDNPQNVISFCTGYGGLEIGIRRAGVDIRTVCNVEIETFAQANLVAKIEEGRMDQSVIYSDLKTFPASIFRGKIHGITGGYPCQPFSSAGKRKGEEDPRHLWPYIRKHVRAIRPLWCFFENVRGHTSMGLWRVLSDLEEDGYETEWGLFSAEETGAPHQRIRCFILAKLPDTRSPYSREVQLTEGRTEEDAKEQESNCNGDQRGVGQLGNPPSLRPRGGSENREGEQSEVLGAGLKSDELGNAKHDGLHGDSFSGGSGKDSERSEKGKEASKQSSGASGQEDLRHLQGAELANPNCDEQTEERGDDGEVLEVSQVEGQELSPTLLGGESTQGGELADPASREPRQSQAWNGGEDIGGGSEEELGNSGIERCEQDSALRDKQQARGVEQVCRDRGSEEELGDTASEGLEGRAGEGVQGGSEGLACADGGSATTQWPARPGEEQYEWEEPRVTEAQSELGGSPYARQGHDRVDPIANRVDRLRLLGNGVVPQTAELAWRTLWKQLNDKHND